MVEIDLDFLAYCENCGKKTWHRTSHKRMETQGIHFKLLDICQECGGMNRELQFR
ncbi:MAG TPA: hypothetical protein VGS11_04540 [Candidatus Bathyarchaeia archaeon]|nr:hypothetical protein [Candidatus Bathyarchaeia archaeon]